uniref:Uncharacterized protein n=1 Tax=Ciona intestinalis TaxID=7719 RepID=H2XKE8_CIOIN
MSDMSVEQRLVPAMAIPTSSQRPSLPCFTKG